MEQQLDKKQLQQLVSTKLGYSNNLKTPITDTFTSLNILDVMGIYDYDEDKNTIGVLIELTATTIDYHNSIGIHYRAKYNLDGKTFNVRKPRQVVVTELQDDGSEIQLPTARKLTGYVNKECAVKYIITRQDIRALAKAIEERNETVFMSLIGQIARTPQLNWIAYQDALYLSLGVGSAQLEPERVHTVDTLYPTFDNILKWKQPLIEAVDAVEKTIIPERVGNQEEKIIMFVSTLFWKAYVNLQSAGITSVNIEGVAENKLFYDKTFGVYITKSVLLNNTFGKKDTGDTITDINEFDFSDIHVLITTTDALCIANNFEESDIRKVPHRLQDNYILEANVGTLAVFPEFCHIIQSAPALQRKKPVITRFGMKAIDNNGQLLEDSELIAQKSIENAKKSNPNIAELEKEIAEKQEQIKKFVESSAKGVLEDLNKKTVKGTRKPKILKDSKLEEEKKAEKEKS